MQIMPISESQHQQAIMTLMAERQELLIYRAEFPKLEQHIEQLEAEVKKLEALNRSQAPKEDILE